MSDYDQITGYIQKIFVGETSTGKDYLGIEFWSDEEHENESTPEIRWWFTSDKAKEITQEKVSRLLGMAGLDPKAAKPTTPNAALKLLARKELVALEIPVTVQPNIYEGKTKAQYDLGWGTNVVSDGFTKFDDLLAERMETIRGKRSDSKPTTATATNTAHEKPEVTVFDDNTTDGTYDDIPF